MEEKEVKKSGFMKFFESDEAKIIGTTIVTFGIAFICHDAISHGYSIDMGIGNTKLCLAASMNAPIHYSAT